MPSTAEGIVEQILYNVNDVVPVGSVIARIKTEVEEATDRKPQATSHTTRNRAGEFRVRQGRN